MEVRLVETRSGLVRGQELEGCVRFLGVPYAAPPVGTLRFAPPVPPTPWTGVRSAEQAAPIAPQPSSGVGSYVPGDPFVQGEDCLAVNVYVPEPRPGRAPVFVFIHGGAFVSGSGSSVMYAGEALARRGLVVVTANYRLGVLGFLAHPGLVDAGGVVANRGLLDQLAVLQWVADNIAAFGGDPANVTLAGESAGAMSVADLCAVPRARRLVRRVVLQSGATLADSAPSGFAMAERFLEIAGLSGDSAGRLADMPIGELLGAQAELLHEAGGETRMPLRPVVDGDVLTEHPDRAFARGDTSGLGLLFGTNRDEFRLFTYRDPRIEQLDATTLDQLIGPYLAEVGAGVDAERVVTAYRTARQARGEDASDRAVFEAIGADLVFRVPVLRLADAHVASGGRAWSYRFDWSSPFADGALGACHALELPFVFGTLANPIIGVFAGTGPEAHALAEEMGGRWADFATHGSPSPTEPDRWPAYEPPRRAVRIFGAGERVVERPGEAERALIDSVLPPYGTLRGATRPGDGGEHRGT